MCYTKKHCIFTPTVHTDKIINLQKSVNYNSRFSFICTLVNPIVRPILLDIQLESVVPVGGVLSSDKAVFAAAGVTILMLLV